MPNHITNVIRFSGDDAHIKDLLTAIQKDEEGFGTFDFNKLIPMPKSLNIECGSDTWRALEIYLTAVNPDTPDKGVPKLGKRDFHKLLKGLDSERSYHQFHTQLSAAEIARYTEYRPLKEMMELGKTAADNVLQYGASTWYDWSIRNWGTKWNAYECYCECDNSFIEFNTAWCGVPLIAAKLAEKFPDVDFTYLWADEDIGHNVGMMRFEKGACVEEYFPDDGTKEAYELCAEVMSDDLTEMGYRYDPETETYQYVEDEAPSMGGMEML